MKHAYKIFVFATLLLSSSVANAQGGYLEYNAAPQGCIGYVAGTPATAGSDVVAHEFMVMPGYKRVFKILNNGRVGINIDGNGNPSALMQVGSGMKSISFDDLGSNQGAVNFGSACIGFNAVRQSSFDGEFRFEPNTTASRNGGSVIWADPEGGLSFTAVPSNRGASGGATTNAMWLTPSEILAYRTMKISPSFAGQVQIGRAPAPGSTHQDYKLAVDGKVVAQSVYVTQNNWADFVFEPNYPLLSLPALEVYLRANKHLPAIPSAAEVTATGVSVGEMEAKLLQTVEELTLHVIALNKQTQQLQAELEALKASGSQAGK